ncbi:Tyrosine recombinase XerD [Candidatus Thermoflexus japonica]|uniref:Tyrosine recombinase XerD n=1 Tax=Candidatus Thermoflexus japonica TaxID=2035417 RepID=A0A2H5Y5A2_9CHLR|nr:Tyrosine recombinase XerD [Candidatus Thermoflexus japonica]
MDPSPEALEFWIIRFLDACVAAEAVSASTWKAYRHTLSSLARFMKSRGISQWAEARAPLLEAFLQDAMARRGWSPSTWNQKVAVLRSFFRFLETEGVIPENPALPLRWCSPRRRIHLPLPVDQRQRLWMMADALPETPLGLRDRLIVALIAHLGLRAGQAVALAVEDVDLTRKRLRIPGRGGPRWRELPEPVLRSLQRYLDAGRPALIRDPETRALLLNHRGEPLTRQGLWRAIKILALRAGLPPSISPERLRQPPGLPLPMNDRAL